MSLIAEGQSHFSGFALCLYYNVDFGHIKTNCASLFFLFPLIMYITMKMYLCSGGTDTASPEQRYRT